MAHSEHPTRHALLDAGLGLAERVALSALSVDEIVRGAGVAKGTFYVHFKDRADYLVALHRQFHDEIRLAIQAESDELPPGRERLERAAAAYLDACLRARGVKAMLAQARGLPGIGHEVAAANDRFAHDIEPDLRALGSAHPLEAARLFVAMTAEVALLELDAGESLTPLRAALIDYLAAV
jgi:TetR/AcrR family transcriptional repressor of nem operon